MADPRPAMPAAGTRPVLPNGVPPTVLVSTPTTRLDFAACVLPMAQHRPFQALFGYEGQLAAFAAGLGAAGVACALLPAPEIFGHQAALAAIRARIGAQPLVHLRFGATRAARVLKGATNLFVAGEQDLAPPIDLGWHPFGVGDLLPPLIAGVLAHGPRHRPLCSLLGDELPVTPLPDAAASADLDLAARPGAPGLTRLQVQSLAEFITAAWTRGGDPAAGPVVRSADLNAALSATPPRRLIALPWNLTHPGGIIADLVIKFARRREPSLGLMLLPFNVDGDALDAIPRLIGHVHAATDAPEASLAAIFVARLRTPQSARSLCRLAPIAWVDGSDPEAGWTLRRLERLGIAAILITGGPHRPSTGAQSAVFHADASMQTELQTPFGRQLQRATTISARRMAGLIELGQAVAASPPPPPRSHEALANAMRPIARLLLPDLPS